MIPSRGHLLSLAALALLLPAARARAETARLAVAVVAQEPSLEGKALPVEQALEELIRKDGRFDPVSAMAKDWSAANRARAEKGRKGQQSFDAAVESFDDLEIQQAVRKLDEAIALLEESDLEAGASPLLEALAFKALVVYARNEHDAEASRLLERLFALEPDYAFKRARLNPRFEAFAEVIRARAKAAPRVTLRLESAQGAGLAYVDGLFAGTTPCEMRDLTPGAHHVVLLAPGFLPFQRTVQVDSDQSYQATLDPSPEGAALQGQRHALAEAFARGTLPQAGPEFARWQGAGEALLLSLARRDGGVEVTAARTTARGAPPLVVRNLFAPGAQAPEMAAFAVSLLGRAMTDRPLLEAAPLAPAPARPPSTLAYVLLGASAASAAGGALLGLSTVDQVNRAERLPQLDAAGYRRARAAAGLTALGANALYALSVASAGAAAWLLFFPPGHGTGPTPASQGDSFSLQLSPLHGGAVLSLERTTP